MTAFDALGAERLVDAWLLEHGDNEIDDEGSTLRDYLECFPEIRSDLESRIARALGSCRQHGEAFSILAPICRDCDRPLSVDDVLANEQPGEDGLWLHIACSDAIRAELRADGEPESLPPMPA